MSNSKFRSYMFSVSSGIILVIVIVVLNILFTSDIKAIFNGNKLGIRNAFLLSSFSEDIIPEIENNDSYELANRIQPNMEYYGSLSDDYEKEKDWYVFTIPKSGGVGFILETVAQSKLEESYWNPTIRSVSSPDERLLNEHIKGKTIRYDSGWLYLTPGEYYFEIESSSYHSKDLYGFKITYNDQVEKYVGSYVGDQGVTNCNFYISEWNGDHIVAFFKFYENPTNPGVPSGRFEVEGTVKEKYNDGSCIVDFIGTKWFDQPDGWEMLNFTATVDEKKGIITSDDYNINLEKAD